MAGLKFDITGDNGNMLSALEGVQNGVKQTQKVVEQSGSGIEEMFGKIGSSATDTATSVNKTTEAMSKYGEALKHDVEVQQLATQSAKELKESLKLYEKGLKEIQTALGEVDYEGNIKKATESLERQKEKLETYKTALANLPKDSDTTGQGANYYNSLIRGAQERISSLTSSIDGWKSKQESLNSDMERYSMLIDVANSRLSGNPIQISSVDNSTQTKSLSELNTMLAESQSKLQQFESEALKLNSLQILSDSQKERLSELNIEISKTKEEIRTLKEQITEKRGETFFGSVRNKIDEFGAKITEAKEKVTEFIVEHTKLNEVKDRIGNNPGIQKFKAEYAQAKGILSDFGKRSGDFLTGNGKLQQSFSNMGTAINGMGLPLKGVGSGIVSVTKSLWAMCATPIGAVITVIVMGLAAMHKYLTKSAEGQKALAQISAYLGSLLSSITDIIVILGKYLFRAFSDANGPMSDFAKSFVKTFTTAIKAVGELIGGFGTALKGIFKMDWDTFSDGMSKMWNGIKDGGKAILSSFETSIKGVIGSAKLVYSAFTDDKLGKELGNAFDGIMSKATKSAELAKRTTEANLAAAKAQEKAAKLDIQIAENKEKIYKLTGKAKDELIEQTKILQKQRYDSILDAQRKQLDIQRTKNRIHTASLADLAKERQLNIDILRTTAEQASSTRMLVRMQESNRRKMEREGKSKSKKDSHTTEAINSANSKFDEVSYVNAHEREKQILDLENRLIDVRISAMVDGAKRASEERERQNKKELEDLEKQRATILEAERKRQKAEFDAEQAIVKARGGKPSAWSNNMFDENSNDVKQINSLFDSLRDETNKKFIRENIDEQRKALNEYLKDYGAFEDKKKAIEQEYNEKIEKSNSVGERASLERQRDKEIEKLSNDEFQESIDWNGVFSDLQGHTTEYLQGLRNQLQELLNTGNLPIDQIAIVSDKINAIDDELGKQQGIWDYVGEKAREHNRLLKEATNAQEVLNKAKKAENEAYTKLAQVKSDVQGRLSNAGVDIGIDDITSSTLNGKLDLTDKKFNDMIPVLQQLAVAEATLTDARKKTANATNKLKQKEDAVKRKSAQKVADWFSDKQEFIRNKGIDQLPTLFDSLGMGGVGKKVQKGLDVFNNASGAAQDFASGNFVGAAIKGIGAITSFGSLLGIGTGNEEEVAKTTERLTKTNEVLKASIDSLKNSIDKSNGAKAIDNYKKAEDNQKQVIANTMQILREQMASWGKHHSNAYYWNLSKADYATLNKTLQTYKNDNPRAETKLDKVNSLNDVYQLTPEQMKAIATNNVKLWEIMLDQGKYDKSEYWKKYIELAGKLEELTEKINENLTRVTFKSLHDDFVSTIMNMDATASDFANNFTEMMAKAWTNAAVGNAMDADLRKFHEKWSKNMQSKDADGNKAHFSKHEIDEMRKEYQILVDKALELREAMKEVTGYTGRTQEQKATANGVTTITYEQANNIVALTTAGNISRDQIKGLAMTVMTNIASLYEFSSSTNSAVLEIRNLMIYNNSYLEDILKCSKTIYNDFSQKIDDVNRNLKEMK